MEKKPLIVGNWKMELSLKASAQLARSLREMVEEESISGDVVVCPSFVALPAVKEELRGQKKIALGAQHVHWEERGAWTGEVSAVQLQELVEWCIVGHSEHRSLTSQRDEQVRQAANTLIAHGITPIICIGESQQERQEDKTVEKITNQMSILLAHTDRSTLARYVIAYEPIWAIGTGLAPDPDDVAEVVLLIRKLVAKAVGKEDAQRLRILYGGSVNENNADSFVAAHIADGALVGGASIHPKEFITIAKKCS